MKLEPRDTLGAQYTFLMSVFCCLFSQSRGLGLSEIDAVGINGLALLGVVLSVWVLAAAKRPES